MVASSAREKEEEKKNAAATSRSIRASQINKYKSHFLSDIRLSAIFLLFMTRPWGRFSAIHRD